MSDLAETRLGRRLLGGLIAIAVAVLAGLVILWPSGDKPDVYAPGLPRDTVTAEVTRVESLGCGEAEGVEPGAGGTCLEFGIRITEGSREGETGVISQSVPQEVGLDPELSVGDKVRVRPPPGEALPGQETPFIFAGFDRDAPLLQLVVIFSALVILFGRFRGAMSLVGLAASLAMVLLFIVPAIVRGEEPLAVAIVGGLAVMLVTILLAHGVTLKSITAILGTTASLLLVALLAILYVNSAHLTGFSSAEAVNLSFQAGLSLEGLLLAGMVIGALGVLDDITVSQASTVLALRSASPDLGFRDLYARASEVGRDHASAAVNTLVLAYVGAALPILLLFSTVDLSFHEALNLEVVSKEVVAMLVGSIGLIAAVPLTTALTAWLALRLEPDSIPIGETEHVH